ncbi:MAG TPA: hypothetical protein VGS22_21810 [Thermoanaerobaculia bacterium]|jgi:hypothetical protein|nr:hypothetical protein [Thermoanaerobaculia bacterium]
MDTGAAIELFEINQGEVTLLVHFSDPQLDLLADLPGFLKVVLDQLGPLGLRLADSRLENVPDFGEVHLRCLFANGTRSVRYFLDRVEIWTASGGWDGLLEFAPKVLESVQTGREIHFRNYTSILTAHGTPKGRTAPEILNDLAVRPLADLGPHVTSGATYYFGADGGRLASILTFDLSAHYSGAIFVRLHQIFDAQAIDFGGVATRVRQDLVSALAFIGLRTESK